MAWIEIPSADVDQGSIIDESLMSGKIKNNDDNHEARIIALEASGSGGSGVDDVFAEVLSGGEDNVGEFWKIRHHIMHSTNASESKAGEDFEQKLNEERFLFDPNFTINSAYNANVQAYLGASYFVEQNEQVQFKIKKGENFFCIGVYGAAVTSVDTRIYVDGVNANTLGLTDESGATVPVSRTTAQPPNRYGLTWHFYGLDGEEHIITIKNEDASAQELPLQYVDAGFRSVDSAINHTLKVNAGLAKVGANQVQFSEGNFSFSKPGIGLANGYTGMLKINQSGTISAVDGLSPASTQLKPNETVAFTGSVTSLKVKNHFAFPTEGICMYQQPAGDTYFFSYGAKGQTGGPQTQSLDEIVWQAQPTEDFTPLPNMAGAIAWVVNEFRGDGRIEYWAKPPIEISAANNKVDFEITQNGTTTAHTATLVNGWYSADLVPLEKAFKEAMQAAKAINGEYFLKYDETSQLWSIGTTDAEVSQIDFLWATGANSSADLGTTLGFTSDLTGASTYTSINEVQHKAQRVFYAEDHIKNAEHPNVKYSWPRTTITEKDAIQEALKFTEYPSYRRTTSGTIIFDIFPDEDCCGLTISTVRDIEGTYATYSIDAGNEVWLGTTDRPNDVSAILVGSLIHWFISFPKGSHKVTIKFESNIGFEIENNLQTALFIGYRQWFTKPPWEALTPSERILKIFEVNPLRLFGTRYGHNTALYAPQPADDNINSITESGTWSQITLSTVFNQRVRRTQTDGGFVDVEFVLQGDGGGIGILTEGGSSESDEVNFYISDTAINETTDYTDKIVNFMNAQHYDQAKIRYLGLPAGTYFARFKNNDTGELDIMAFEVYDTVPPQLDAPTLAEINNTGQSIAFPIHTRKRNFQRYGAFKRPENIAEEDYNIGIVSHADYLVAAHNIINYNNQDLWRTRGNLYYSAIQFTDTGDYAHYITICRSLTVNLGHFSTNSLSIQPAIDGRNLSAVSSQSQVKNGFAPSATRPSYTPAVFFDFEHPVTHSASLTFNMTDTTGLRNGQKVILEDNVGAQEESIVENIVTDTSFDIKQALSVITAANVVKVYMWGVHNVRMTANDAAQWEVGFIEFEPLPIEKSQLQARIKPDLEDRTWEDLQVFTATGTVDFEYPTLNWATVGNPKNTELEYKALPGSITLFNTNTYRLTGTSGTWRLFFKLKAAWNKALKLAIRG